VDPQALNAGVPSAEPRLDQQAPQLLAVLHHKLRLGHHRSRAGSARIADYSTPSWQAA
jgi:hypothetical protein